MRLAAFIRHLPGWSLAALLLMGQPGQAAPLSVPLEPGTARIELTIYLMGFIPLPARFARFSGNLRADPAAPGQCAVTLDIQAASLQMDDPAHIRLAIGPQLLNAARYPDMHFAGRCTQGHVAGMLTLHGTTRPLDLTTRQDGTLIDAQGRLQRRAFGVDGMPGLIGGTIGLRIQLRLPNAFAAAASATPGR